ncbi:hypothetical protein MC885_015630 [Smutsia gigantea]|nr:hypothetical protein MC885_015630 [Smutsia gigantea]
MKKKKTEKEEGREICSDKGFLLSLNYIKNFYEGCVCWALQLVIVLVPGATFHLYAACKSINQECILQKPTYTVIYILSVLLRISLEVIAFWLQIHLFDFQVNSLYLCDVGSLEKKFTIIKCMVPEHLEKTIFLIAMYTFTIITMVFRVAEIFEIIFRRLRFPIRQ